MTTLSPARAKAIPSRGETMEYKHVNRYPDAQRPPATFRSAFGRSAALLGLVVGAGATLACAGQTGTALEEDSGELGTHSNALQVIPGNPSGATNEWRDPWSAILAGGGGPQIPYSMDPTICTNQQRAYLTV